MTLCCAEGKDMTLCCAQGTDMTLCCAEGKDMTLCCAFPYRKRSLAIPGCSAHPPILLRMVTVSEISCKRQKTPQHRLLTGC